MATMTDVDQALKEAANEWMYSSSGCECTSLSTPSRKDG